MGNKDAEFYNAFSKWTGFANILESKWFKHELDLTQQKKSDFYNCGVYVAL